MNTGYRYQLENRKLTGKRQQKFTCPNCGKKKCFVRSYPPNTDLCDVLLDSP